MTDLILQKKKVIKHNQIPNEPDEKQVTKCIMHQSRKSNLKIILSKLGLAFQI